MTDLHVGKPLSVPAQTSSDKGNDWVQYFGEPLYNHRMHANAHQEFDRYDLPEFYKGKNLFLANRIQGLIMDNEDLLWTRKILPIVRTDQLSIQFNTWDFSETLAGRVPHEGISRIIRSRKSQHSGAMERRGLAFILEHGFLKTEEGRQQYMLNIKQIVQAVQVTLNFDVLSSLLTCKRHDIEWLKQHGYFRQHLPAIMQREVSMFGIIQKDVNGFDIAIEQYKKQLRRYSVAPDALIMPSKLQMYIPMVPEEKMIYSNRGKLAVDQFEAGPIKKFRNITIYEAKPFDLGNGTLPVNLMSSDEQIGQYNTMALDENLDPSNHRSEHRDIMIYDADTDDFTRISFLDAIKNSMRFGEEASDAHRQLAENSMDEKQLLDPFMFNDVQDVSKPWKKAGVFGQMHQSGTTDFLPKKLLDKIIRSTTAQLPPRIVADFEDGCLYVEELAVAKAITWKAVEEKAKTEPRAQKFISAFRKVVKHLQQIYPKSYFLNADTRPAANAEWIQRFTGYYQEKVQQAFQTVTGGSESQRPEILIAMLFFVLFNGTAASGAEIIFPLGSTAAPASMAAPMPDISQVHAMNISALGHSEANIGQVYQDAAAKHDVGTPVHKRLVQGVSQLIATHVDNLKDPVFVKTCGMLGKISGRATTDIRHMEKMGFAEASAATSIPAAATTTEPHAAWGSFSGSPMYQVLASCQRAEAPVEEVADQRESNVFSRLNKRASIGEPMSLDKVTVQYATENFVKRMESTANMASHLERLIGAGFLTTTLEMSSIENMHANDIVIPFDVLLARPFMEFEMNHGMLTKAGRETGATYVGHSDFQLGDNVQSKLHYGNYTFYAKSLVSNPKNVVLLKNIFINNYKGGFNTQFWSEENGGLDDKNDEKFTTGDRPSIFAMLLPTGSANHSKVMGQDPVDLRRKMPYYADMLRFRELEDPTYDEEFFTPNSVASPNAIVYKGMQYSYDGSTGRFSKITLGTGHLGKNIYPGVGQVYRGAMKYMEKTNYTQTF